MTTRPRPAGPGRARPATSASPARVGRLGRSRLAQGGAGPGARAGVPGRPLGRGAKALPLPSPATGAPSGSGVGGGQPGRAQGRRGRREGAGAPARRPGPPPEPTPPAALPGSAPASDRRTGGPAAAPLGPGAGGEGRSVGWGGAAGDPFAQGPLGDSRPSLSPRGPLPLAGHPGAGHRTRFSGPSRRSHRPTSKVGWVLPLAFPSPALSPIKDHETNGFCRADPDDPTLESIRHASDLGW